MPQATTKRRQPTKPTTASRRAAHRKQPTAIQSTTKLSTDVLDSLEKGQTAAIDAVRKFVDTVDHTLPALPHDAGPSRRQEIIDSALEMADRLVHTQHDFIHKVIESAGKSLSGTNGAK